MPPVHKKDDNEPHIFGGKWVTFLIAAIAVTLLVLAIVLAETWT